MTFNIRDKNSSGNDRHPQNDPQEGSSNGHQNGSTIVSDPSQSQFPMSALERRVTNQYPVLISVLPNLNRMDFRNLQLAGIRTPVSEEVQRQYLIPSKCDEKLVIVGMKTVTCTNTTRTVREIKACHGIHHDGFGVRSRQARWIEPTRLFKHAHKSDSHIESNGDGGHFDSFNVCIHCRERDRERRRPYEDFAIGRLHTTLCQHHCLKYLARRPYNQCRCRTYLDKYWRCHTCCLATLGELRLRAQAFGRYWFLNFEFDEKLGRYVHAVKKTERMRDMCPVLGCSGESWLAAPLDQKMFMCCACTAICKAV
ncbi:hypothetical protein MMC07_001521 [Pseudocyphellaria aurata]|nr:hypothetical protein [Pseudocyphellaria aurata]